MQEDILKGKRELVK